MIFELTRGAVSHIELMPNYNVWDKQDKRGSGGYNKGGHDRPERRSFGGDRGFDKPMFPAVCVECGERCQVPFKPTNGKPVYCTNCFRRDERPGGDRPSFQPRRDDRPQRDNRFEGPAKSHDNRNDFEQLNRKLDAIIELLKGKVQPAKDAKIHVVTTEAQAAAPKAEKAAKAEPKAEEPKADKKKSAKVATVKADKKKKK